MKKLFFLLWYISLLLNSNAQSAFQNFGNVQIHNGGKIGFHTNVINNGTFNQNAGLAGFYNRTGTLSVSGNNVMSFNNVEVDVFRDLFLETSLDVTNELSFLTGKVVTPRNNLGVSLNFVNYFVYAGENDSNYVDGYAATINNSDFTFPIGDDNSLRPMLMPEQANNSAYSGAYFRENPNTPSTFSTSFDTSKKEEILVKISEVEFWDLNGTEETQIVLTWDIDSNIPALTTDISTLNVVGWDIKANQWVNLGGENIQGTLYEGSVQSITFNPKDYEVITIGSDFKGVLVEESFFTINSFSPNGDGINDFLVIEGLELRGNNLLQIFNRWGTLVYTKGNYDNSWDGTSQHKLTINSGKGLPTGTYFYVLKLIEEDKTYTGFIQILR